MADLLRKPWLEAQLLSIVATASSTRLPFQAKGYLQARKFHNYRYTEGTKELNPEELICADVSDKFCSVRCTFTRACELRMKKEKGWRLTELRGAILAKATGVVRIYENDGLRGLSVALEIDSFSPHGDAGGAVFGEPSWFDDLPQVRQLLNGHNILKLVVPVADVLDDIRSQASDDSSEPEIEGYSTQVNTQPVGPARRIKSKKLSSDSGPKHQTVRPRIPVITSDSISSDVIVKRRRLHTGWADFRDLTYYDCQVPVSQQRILDSEECWMPQGEYVIQTIKHKSRKKQHSINESHQKQTRLTMVSPIDNSALADASPDDLTQIKTSDRDTDDVSLNSHAAIEDDLVSWAESPEPIAVKEAVYTFSAADLIRIRQQHVDNIPPPDSSPSAPPEDIPALDADVVQRRDTTRVVGPDINSSRCDELLVKVSSESSAMQAVYHADDSVMQTNPKSAPSDMSPKHNLGQSAGTDTNMLDLVGPSARHETLEVLLSTSPLRRSSIPSTPIDNLTLDDDGLVESTGEQQQSIMSSENDQILSAPDSKNSTICEVLGLASPKVLATSGSIILGSEDILNTHTASAAVPEPVLTSVKKNARSRTIPWVQSTTQNIPSSASSSLPSSTNDVSRSTFVNPYTIAARKPSRSPRTSVGTTRPWQRSGYHQLTYHSPGSQLGSGSPVHSVHISNTPVTSTVHGGFLNTPAQDSVSVEQIRHANHRVNKISANSSGTSNGDVEIASSSIHHRPIAHSTPLHPISVVKDTPTHIQRQSNATSKSPAILSRDDKLKSVLAGAQATSGTLQGRHNAPASRSTRRMKFDLSKLQQNGARPDVRDLLAHHRATFLRLRQPPPAIPVKERIAAPVASTAKPVTRKRKLDEVEETQAIVDTTNAGELTLDQQDHAQIPWHEDPDTPLRKLLRTTLRPRSPFPAWHVESWRDRLDALDDRNRARGG